MQIAVWLIQRLREPSTYAGLAVLIGTFGVPDATSWAHNLTLVGTGVAGIAAMLLKEVGAPNR